jgi:hypothetical protein
VGHPPERSPYKNLRAKQAAQFVTGYLFGDRGEAGIGPADGPIFGIRYDRAVGTPLDIQLGLSYGHLTRNSVDPTKPVATRLLGRTTQDLVMMEAGMSLVVTGRKTWRGFAPYVGGTIGVAFETDIGSDITGYQFGTKALFTPHLGLKWYPIQAFAIKFEARDYIWRLSYPETYIVSYQTGIPPVLPSGKTTEWTHHPALLFSVGYTFTF